MIDASKLLRDYEIGVGFRKGDVLRPREGARPSTHEVIDKTVVVLRQDSLAPHEYTVIGERANPKQPSERFVKFSINGHDWEKVGHAR